MVFNLHGNLKITLFLSESLRLLFYIKTAIWKWLFFFESLCFIFYTKTKIWKCRFLFRISAFFFLLFLYKNGNLKLTFVFLCLEYLRFLFYIKTDISNWVAFFSNLGVFYFISKRKSQNNVLFLEYMHFIVYTNGNLKMTFSLSNLCVLDFIYWNGNLEMTFFMIFVFRNSALFIWHTNENLELTFCFANLCVFFISIFI